MFLLECRCDHRNWIGHQRTSILFSPEKNRAKQQQQNITAVFPWESETSFVTHFLSLGLSAQRNDPHDSLPHSFKENFGGNFQKNIAGEKKKKELASSH